ncbi:MAG: rhodanese-like domain-containing protein [Candidatus Omnitrophica bacterium]|nr:rhodanese-like domain-containing protein [Candidatus Omnitrophota bacterium]
MPTTAARRPAIKNASPTQLRRYFEAKLAAELGPHNVKRLLDEQAGSVVLLDVRSREGFAAGHVPGAVNIPFEELPTRFKELPKSKDILAYCWSVTCLLCTKAAYVLASKGYRAREMIGGIESWQEAGFPVEKST